MNPRVNLQLGIYFLCCLAASVETKTAGNGLKQEGTNKNQLRFSSESEVTGFLQQSSELIKPSRSPIFTIDDVLESSGDSCGDGFCRCNGSHAWCVSKNLTFIPSFGAINITRLNFFDNFLKHLDDDTLRDLSSLQYLNLEMNRLDYISANAFDELKSLQELRLGVNNFTDFDGLVANLTHVAGSLNYLNVRGNHFDSFTLGSLLSLHTLETLEISRNAIRQIQKGNWRNKTILGQLRCLDLGWNLLTSFPEFCREDAPEESLFPFLETLNVQWNIITNMSNLSTWCLPKLRNLTLRGNSIYYLQRNFLQGLPSLDILNLQFCMSRSIDSHAFNHSNLKHLDVSENLWFFDTIYGSEINLGLFKHMPQLQHINISWTVFEFTDERERQIVLTSVSQVEELVMQGTMLSYIPSTILTAFKNLTSLIFSMNSLQYLADNTFENLSGLRNLDLKNNRLTSVRLELLEDILKHQGKNASFDFSNNPFSCTCDHLWFIERYKEDASSRQEDRLFVGEPYVCNEPIAVRGQSLRDVDITRFKCTLNNADFITILFVTSFAIILLILGSVVYKFRWRLRFMVYTLQHRLSMDRSPTSERTFKYDVFVSYDTEDTSWVLGTLVPELETQRGLKLCIHERDFLPGTLISHNIIDKMEESSTILPVLSNAFLHSDWCRFELFLAVKNCMQRRSSAASRRAAVLPVLLESLRREDVDNLVSALLSTTTYLAWPEDGDEQRKKKFWNTLCSVLNRGR